MTSRQWLLLQDRTSGDFFVSHFRVGFMLFCPWRVEMGRRFEYWDRYQIGPFYVLDCRPR